MRGRQTGLFGGADGPDGGHSKCKGHEVGACLGCSRGSKEASMAGVEGMGGEEPEKPQGPQDHT